MFNLKIDPFDRPPVAVIYSTHFHAERVFG